MRIFRYLFKEVTGSFIAVAIVLLLIFVSGRFVKYLAQAASGSFSSDVLFSIMLFRLPGFMELILPLALFIGIMLSFGRLYVESEMVVLQACGISKKQLLLYLQGPAFLVMLLVAVFSTYLTPLGWKHFHQIWNDPKTYSGLSTLVSGSFKKLGSEGAVIYASAINQQKTELTDVFIVSSVQSEGKDSVTLVKASQAKVVSFSPYRRFIELYDGVEYSGQPGKLDYRFSRFKTYGQRIQESKDELIRVDSIDAMPTLSIVGATGAKEQAAFFWRISLPFMVPILALIALALSETNHRKGRFIKLLPGIIIFILYVAVLIAIRTEIEKERLTSGYLFFAAHIGFLALGFVLLYFAELINRLKKIKRSRA